MLAQAPTKFGYLSIFILLHEWDTQVDGMEYEPRQGMPPTTGHLPLSTSVMCHDILEDYPYGLWLAFFISRHQYSIGQEASMDVDKKLA